MATRLTFTIGATLWLILFGIVHAYLLWVGDILYPYALCGLILYPFRKMTARRSAHHRSSRCWCSRRLPTSAKAFMNGT